MAHTDPPRLEIVTDRANGEVDLKFGPDAAPEDIDDLHDVVLPSIEGASMRGDVRDSVVAVAEPNFDVIVQSIDFLYRSRGLIVTTRVARTK